LLSAKAPLNEAMKASERMIPPGQVKSAEIYPYVAFPPVHWFLYTSILQTDHRNLMYPPPHSVKHVAKVRAEDSCQVDSMGWQDMARVGRLPRIWSRGCLTEMVTKI